jgi:NAD(P)-dependent dehydrogenase (short-subunit alcohol dehydrogenase family)
LDRPLEGKTALITGAGRGIGRAIAVRLHASGAKVALCGRHEGAVRAVAATLGAGARAYRCDVRDRAMVDATVARAADDFGGLHILVNNAGLSGHTPIDSEDDELWSAILETNLTGVWNCTRAAVRYMPQGGDARIINISSVLGKFGVAERAAYCAAKHGVIGFTRAAAVELAGRGIAVNAVCPGWVDTEMAKESMQESSRRLGIDEGEYRRRALEAVPQKRMLDAAEVASLVHYLCLPESRGITGQALSICGGQTVFS